MVVMVAMVVGMVVGMVVDTVVRSSDDYSLVLLSSAVSSSSSYLLCFRLFFLYLLVSFLLRLL